MSMRVGLVGVAIVVAACGAGANGDLPAAPAGPGGSADAGKGPPTTAPAGGAEDDAGGDASDAGIDAGPTYTGPVPFPIEGFGRTAVGGWVPGHDGYVVTSLDDSGPGTLREGLDSAKGPRIITFGLDGTIVLQNSLLVPSNLSIDGRGHAITIKNRGLILVGTDDVILTHLTIEDITAKSEDGVRIGDPTGGASERVVLDHLTFRATGNHGDSANVDEATSVIFGSKDITFQWLRFENWEKVLLAGNGDAPAEVDANITVSMHHIYAKDTGRRHPQARYGVYDLWNVFFDDWHMYDWWYLPPYRESFGVQSQDGARIRFENSLARRMVFEKDDGSQANDVSRCESGGKLDSVNIVITNDSSAPLAQNTGCTNGPTGWTRPYPITLEAPDAALRQKLETLAGNTP